MLDRSIDILVARKVMGWADWRKYPVASLPAFSTSAHGVDIVEQEIGRKGLQGEYLQALKAGLKIEALDEVALWKIIRASPVQKCIAALKAVGYELYNSDEQ